MLVGRFFHFLNSRLGWYTGGLAFSIIVAVRVLLTTEDGLSHMVLPAGTEAGESSSSGSWRKYFDLSSDNEGNTHSATGHNQPTEAEVSS